MVDGWCDGDYCDMAACTVGRVLGNWVAVCDWRLKTMPPDERDEVRHWWQDMYKNTSAAWKVHMMECEKCKEAE